MTKAEPNVVPLCDILLVLLIIFMIAAPMSRSGIDLMLPAGTGEPGPAIVLTIDKEGPLKLNRDSYTNLDDLRKKLVESYQLRNDKTLFIKIHETVHYKYVIEIIDVVKGSGVEKICPIGWKTKP